MWNKVLLLIGLVACSSLKEDPLKNTRKLVKEGHATLYNNGAFQIPATKIKLVPPGPDAIQLAKELTGIGAKASFLKYIEEVKASSVVIYEGGKKSYKLAGEVDKEFSKALSGLGKNLKKNSKVILKSTYATSKSPGWPELGSWRSRFLKNSGSR